MPTTPSRHLVGMGIGCLAAFALPFAVAGVVMTWAAARTASRHTAAQSWVEVPAVIKQAELKRKPGGESDTFQAIAVYEYEFGGRRFTGERVSIHGGSDNIGSFQQDAYRELKRHLDQKRPFRCFVNPRDPTQAVIYRDLRWEMQAFHTMFATTFGSLGFGLLTGAVVAARKLPRAVNADAAADQPWLARSDWASGQIRPTGGTAVAMPVLGVLALYWNVASLPLLSKLPVILPPADSQLAWLTLLFPAVGLLLVFAFLHQLRRRRKFGESTLQLASTPGMIGGQLAGVVNVSNFVPADSGFRLKLSCIERVRKDEDSTSEDVLWQDERLVKEPMRDRVTGSMALPVLFAIPYTAQETSRVGSTRDIAWRLDVSSKMPGVDYKSRFEVPVYKTADSQPDFQIDEKLAAEFTAAPPREMLLREAGIIKEPLPGAAVRLVFPAARNLGSALVATGFLAIWSAAIWLMVSLGAPILLPIFFGLFELLLIWIVIDLWFYRSVVEARADRLTFRGGLFGIGRLHAWAANDIERFDTSDSMSTGAHVWKNIVLVPRNGKKRTIAQSIYGKLAQQAVIGELNTALRRSAENDSTL